MYKNRLYFMVYRNEAIKGLDPRFIITADPAYFGVIDLLIDNGDVGKQGSDLPGMVAYPGGAISDPNKRGSVKFFEGFEHGEKRILRSQLRQIINPEEIGRAHV